MSACVARPRFLLVDDDPIHREFMQRLLGARVHLEEAETGAQALASLGRREFDVVLLDNRLPDCRASDLLPKLDTRGCAVIVLTALATPELTARVRRLGARACLQKDRVSLEGLLTHPSIAAAEPAP